MDRTPLQNISSLNKFAVLLDPSAASAASDTRSRTERVGANPIPSRALYPTTLPSPPPDSDRSARGAAIPFLPKSYARAASNAADDKQQTIVSPKMLLNSVINARHMPPRTRLNGLLLAAHNMDRTTQLSKAEARILLAETILTLEDCWQQADAAELIDTIAGKADYPALLIRTNEVTRLANPEIRRITVFKLLEPVECGPIQFNEKDIRISLDGLSKPLAVSLANSAAHAVLQNELEQLRIDDVPQDRNARSLRSELHEALKRLDGYGTKKQDDQSITFSRANTKHLGAIPENPKAVNELMLRFGSNGTRAKHPISFARLTILVKSLPKRALLPDPGDIFWHNLANNLEQNLKKISSKDEALGWIAILRHMDRNELPGKSVRSWEYPDFMRIAQVALTLLSKLSHISGNDLVAIVSAFKHALPTIVIGTTYKACRVRIPPIPGEMRISPQALGTIYEGFRYASISVENRREKVGRSDPHRDLSKSGIAAKLIPYIREAHFDNVNDVCEMLRGAVGIHYTLAGEICELILDRGLLDASPDRVLTAKQLTSLAGFTSALTSDQADKIAQLLTQHLTVHDTTALGAMHIIEKIALNLTETRSDAIVSALLPSIRMASENNVHLRLDNEILNSMKVLPSLSSEVATELGEVLCAMIGRGALAPVDALTISFALKGAMRLPHHMQEQLAPHLAAYANKITTVYSRTFFRVIDLILDTTTNPKLFEIARSLIKNTTLNGAKDFRKENLIFEVLLQLGPLCKDNPVIREMTQEMIARIEGKVPLPSQLTDPEQLQALTIEALSATTYLQLNADVPRIDLHGADKESGLFIFKHGIPLWKQMQGEELVIRYGAGKHKPRNVGKMKEFAEETLENMGIPKAAIQDTGAFEHPNAEDDIDNYTNSLLISRRIAWPSTVPKTDSSMQSTSKNKAPTRTIIGTIPSSPANFGTLGARLSTPKSLKAQDAKLAAAKAECMDDALKNGFNWTLMSRGVTLSSTDGNVLNKTLLVKLHLAGSEALARLGLDRGDVTATLRSQAPFFDLCEDETGFPVTSIVAAIRDADSVKDLDDALATFLPWVEQRQAGMVLKFSQTSAGESVTLPVHEVLTKQIEAHRERYGAKELPQFKANLHRIVEDYTTFCFQMAMLEADSDADIADKLVNDMQTLVANEDAAAPTTANANKAQVPLLKHSFTDSELDDTTLPGLLAAAFSVTPKEDMTTRDFEHDGKAYRLNCTFRFGHVEKVHIEERYGEPRTLLQMSEQEGREVLFNVVLARGLAIKSPEVVQSTMNLVVEGALKGIRDNRPSPIEVRMPVPLQARHGKQAYSVAYEKSDDGVVTSLQIDEREFRTIYWGRSVSATQQVAALKEARIDASQVKYMWPLKGENDNEPSGYAYITEQEFTLAEGFSKVLAKMLHPDSGDPLNNLNYKSNALIGVSQIAEHPDYSWKFTLKSNQGSAPLIEISSFANIANIANLFA